MLWPVLLLGLLSKTVPTDDDDPAATDDDDPAATDENTDDEDDEDSDDDEVKDPEKKRLSAEAAKWRKKFRAAEARIAELEAGDDRLRSARLEAAFLRAVMGHDQAIGDVETAWDLASAKGYMDPVKVEENGTVAGMAEALNRLLGRYPYLVDEDDGTPAPMPTTASGRPPPPQKGRAGVDRAALGKRFPALGRRR